MMINRTVTYLIVLLSAACR